MGQKNLFTLPTLALKARRLGGSTLAELREVCLHEQAVEYASSP